MKYDSSHSRYEIEGIADNNGSSNHDADSRLTPYEKLRELRRNKVFNSVNKTPISMGNRI